MPPKGYPGVFLAYASERGTAFIDRALYLPQTWIGDRDRRTEARVSEEVRFATKIALAQRMLVRAFAADVPAQWVVADSFYGRSHAFRRWLEGRGVGYATMIPKTHAVRYHGRRVRAEQLSERLPTPEVPAWVCLALSEECTEGMGRWLLIRCDADEPDEDAYWLAYGPAETNEEELVRVCDARWQIERVSPGQICTGERRGGHGSV